MFGEEAEVTFLVCGGAGFIGSSFIRLAFDKGHEVFVLDALTYAGHKCNLISDYGFYEGSICASALVSDILMSRQPDAVFNFAAESHVCRSIAESSTFVESNVRGTHILLTECLSYWRARGEPKEFRYVQISTDEVFGDLGPTDAPFTEASPLRPHSPYAASKCAADHFVAAFAHTYGLPVLTTRCSNNYGPRQYPEKLIPAAISSFLHGKPFCIHGDGSNVRDWISVEDHCRGILAAWARGVPGQSYCFGGAAERTNKEVVMQIAKLLRGGDIEYGPDRPGNDRRYAIDFSRATRELGWRPRDNFEARLAATVNWYCENQAWIRTAMERT